MVGRGLHVRAPTWDLSGDHTRCPTILYFRGVAQLGSAYGWGP